MTGVVFIGLLCLVIVAMMIYGALCRIADAVEAQNKHYGIGLDIPAEKTKAQA